MTTSTRLTLAGLSARMDASDARLDRILTLLEGSVTTTAPAAATPATPATPAPAAAPAAPVTDAVSKSKAARVLSRAHPEKSHAPKGTSVWFETHEGIEFVIAATLTDAKGALLGAMPLASTKTVVLEKVSERPYKQTSAWVVRKGTKAQLEAFAAAAHAMYASKAANR
jgi:hypothetical protein